MTSKNENIALSNYSLMGIKKKSRLHLFWWIFFKRNNSIYFLGKMKNILIYPIIWICTYFFLLQHLQVHNHKIIFILVFRDCNSAIWWSCSFTHLFSHLSSNMIFSTSDIPGINMFIDEQTHICTVLTAIHMPGLCSPFSSRQRHLTGHSTKGSTLAVCHINPALLISLSKSPSECTMFIHFFV